MRISDWSSDVCSSDLASKVARLIAWSLVCGLAAFPVAPAGEFSPLTVRVIQRFMPGSAQTRYGSLEFLGGLRYSSSDSRVGGVSAIRFRPNGRDFLAVLDTGKWMTGAIERDGEGRLSGLARVSVVPRSEEHTSELTSLMRISYAVF